MQQRQILVHKQYARFHPTVRQRRDPVAQGVKQVLVMASKNALQTHGIACFLKVNKFAAVIAEYPGQPEFQRRLKSQKIII
jgi:hypothetical protein